MICCTFQGRLGNQLFEYAFVRAIYEARGCRDELVFDFRQVECMKTDGVNWKNYLTDYNILPYMKAEGHPVWNYASFLQKAVYALSMGVLRFVHKFDSNFDDDRIYRLMVPFGYLYYSNESNQRFEKVPETKNVFIFGHFENPLYFDSVKSILRREFYPKSLAIVDSDFFSRVCSSNSVCVTVRHGSDYLKTPLDIVNADYFRRAIVRMEELVSKPVFFFFSDDVEWCRNEFSFVKDAYFEPGTDTVSSKLYLMSQCRHFIISNSTFSWWAQYLGSYEQKIVISPDKWVYINGKAVTTPLLLDSFIKI